jgi:hypothetical protein
LVPVFVPSILMLAKGRGLAVEYEITTPSTEKVCALMLNKTIDKHIVSSAFRKLIF